MGLILVVSEDTVEIETIRAALSVHGWWVTVAVDREVALQVAADQAPKLVIVDHCLPDSIDLVRSFGTVNGGPGALVFVTADFEGSLELSEAGADEQITKPLSPPRVLEAVQRCLAAPRPMSAERTEPSRHLLTTEEIFGDVLKELEGEPPPAPAPAVPPPAEVAPVAVAQTEPLPPAKPVVSLAGLFENEDEIGKPIVVNGAALAAELQNFKQEEAEALWTSAEGDASAGEGDDWDGAERRSVDRPWSAEDEPTSAGSAPSVAELLSSIAVDEPAVDPAVIETYDDSAPDVGNAEVVSTDTVSRFPKAALLIGSIAAVLLVVVGVVFVVNPGSDEGSTPIHSGESVEVGSPGLQALPTAPSDVDAIEAETLMVEPLEVAAAEAPEEAPQEAADDADDLDLEAIVDQELERREDELRRVFLEEEKRLLRELTNLEDAEPEGEDGPSEDGEDGSGVGR